MMRLGNSLVTRREIQPVSLHLERLGAVTGDEVAAVAARVLLSDRSLSIVGPPELSDALIS